MPIEIKSAADIEALLLKIIQESNVDPDCIVLPETIPDRDIKGFDSLAALEALTELEEETGLHFEEDIFYVDVKPKTGRTVHEVALAIWNQLPKGGLNHA